MQPLAIDPVALRTLAAHQGIDTVVQLAERTGVSQWVLYRALRDAEIMPSHAIAIATALGVEIDGFARANGGGSAA